MSTKLEEKIESRKVELDGQFKELVLQEREVEGQLEQIRNLKQQLIGQFTALNELTGDTTPLELPEPDEPSDAGKRVEPKAKSRKPKA
jgi:hypothetical protein